MFLGLERKEKSCDRNAEKNFFVDSIKSSELNLKEKKRGMGEGRDLEREWEKETEEHEEVMSGRNMGQMWKAVRLLKDTILCIERIGL